MKEVGFLGRMYDEFLWFFTRAFHGSPQNYCDIESAEPPWMLVAQNGGLGGALRINGVRQLQDETSFLEMIGKIAQDLGPALSHKGHVIQVCWYRNSENIINSLEKALRPSRETTKRLELDLGDIIDEEARVLSEYTADEQVYMVLWTMPEVLPIKLRREAQEEMKSLTAENLPGGKDGGFGEGQKFLRSISQLRDRHLAFVFALRQAFDAAGIDIEEVGAHEILREARAALYPYCTDESWRPRLPGDRIPRRIVERENLEPGDLLYQKISEQLIPFDGVRLPGELIKIGERIWAPIVVSLGPVNPMPFNRLLGRIVETGDIPFRMSFLIEGDGIDVLKYKVQLARLLSWDPVSANNRNLIAVKEALSELRDRQNEQIAKLRITAATWADTETEARRRKALLVRAIQSWGSCDTEACGDPLGALLSAIPAFRVDSPAPAMAPPIPDLIAILPITRPASPWKAAPMLLRSVDGKLFPYDMRSSRQTAHVTLGNAPMRAGKSVFSNKALLDFILHPMNEQLPRVGIIDVGASSSGLISLLKGALGRRAYLAEFFRLVMDPRRYAVNPFDTPLGSRYPTQLQMGFLQNLLLLLLTPLDQDAPPKGMEGLVQHAIEFIYRHFGSEKPKLYNRGQNQYLDEMIEKMSIRVDSKTSWWNIVDQFFERAQTSDNESMTHAAMLAQRYAMPLLEEVAAAASNERVGKIYSSSHIEGESMAGYFYRVLTAAVHQYPILNQPTVFDIGAARVVSIDLMDVTQPGGGPQANRQTAVMYMLARHIVAGDFYQLPEHFIALTEEQLPAVYRKYHIDRAARQKGYPKQIVFDEFHRTRGQAAARRQIEIDIREGPKHNVGVALFSQMAEDFDRNMTNLETTILNFGAASSNEVDVVMERYGLPEAARYELKNRMRKPSSSGSHVVARFRTDRGDYTHHLMVTVGPKVLWALSTTPRDMALREKMYQALGPEEARKVLALRFPGGTAEQEIERRIERRRQETGDFAEHDQIEVIDKLAEELVSDYRRLLFRAR